MTRIQQHSAPPRALRRGVNTLISIMAATAAAVSHAKPPKDPYVDGEVLVRLHSATTLSQVLDRHGLAVASQAGARPLYRLAIADGGQVLDKVKELAADPDVIAAEPNVNPRSPEARKNVVWAIGTETDYREQWAPGEMQLAEAQAISRGDGVRVAVLDTGVDPDHPALAGRLLPGRDFIDGDLDPREEGDDSRLGYGHGTHVAGLVALAAPGAAIMPVRVLDPDGRGDVWVIAQALAWAVDPDGNPATDDGAQIINLSLGTLDRTRMLDTLTRLASCDIPPPTNKPDTDFTDPGYDGDKARCAAGRGAVVVAAGGNDGSSRVKEYPAAEGVYGLLPMGATAQDHRLADFSNKGSWIDVAAPGDHITSAIPGGRYGTWSGTSMAAPLAAGVAALVRAAAPGLAPVDVAKRIERSGAAVCGPVNVVQVNALAAVRNRKSKPLNCP